MNEATCATCPLWYAFPAADGIPTLGECRRHPPGRVLHAFQAEEDHAPRTAADYWCGEHPARRDDVAR